MGGIDVVDTRYRPLYERAVAVLEAGDRVAAVELAGSIGAGTAVRGCASTPSVFFVRNPTLRIAQSQTRVGSSALIHSTKCVVRGAT